MSRPFEGIRVIDITHVLAGPHATYQLALLGADVIKVERPGEPDQSREQGPDTEANKEWMGTGFLSQGSNKRSITLDLKTPQGQEILKKLVKDADVLVENYRSGALRDLGLGYEDLIKIKPDLVYCSMTAWGQDGPRGSQTAYDQVIQGYAGVMSITGTEDSGPVRCGPQVLDFGCGITGAFTIASALFNRERTGEGQHIDLCLTDTAFIMMGSQITASLRVGKELGPQTTGRGRPSHSCYQAKDKPIMVGANNNREHTRLYESLDRPDLGNKSYEERAAQRDEEVAFLSKTLKTKTAQEWEDYLQSKHVPAVRQRTVAEAISDPQVKHRGVFYDHKEVPGINGPCTVPMSAFKFMKDGPRVDTPPPRMGQHNEDVLSELGYSDSDIKSLKQEGVI